MLREAPSCFCSHRYELGCALVATNLPLIPFIKWNEGFTSERSTSALLGWIAHHVHILN